MLTTSDLLHLPYTPDLTEGGINYACRSLASSSNRIGDAPFDRLRSIAAGVSVELAFRRCLTNLKVPFAVRGAEPFTNPDHFYVSLGGHRSELISYLISRRQQILDLRKDPGVALQAAALVPLDELAAEGHKPDDLYLFAIFTGLTAAGHSDVERALAAGRPTYFIHPLPNGWSRPVNWLPFENLILKSDQDIPVSIELGGLDSERNFITSFLELPSRKRIQVEQTFYSLSYIHYLHDGQSPSARIGIYSARCGEAHVIQPFDWGNLWIYGMDILLIGWLTHEEYRHTASVLNAGMRSFQFDHTGMKNLQLPMAQLNPVGNLFDQVRQWGEMHRNMEVHHT